MADCKCREEGCAICDPPFKSAIQEELAALRAQLAEAQATIARQRAWIEKAGHRRKCSVRAPHAATMDYKPTCDCGYSELTEN